MMLHRKKKIDPESLLDAFQQFPQAKEGLRIKDITRLVKAEPLAYPKMASLIKDRQTASRARSLKNAFARILFEDEGSNNPRLTAQLRQSYYVKRMRKNVKFRKEKVNSPTPTGREEIFYILM